MKRLLLIAVALITLLAAAGCGAEIKPREYFPEALNTELPKTSLLPEVIRTKIPETEKTPKPSAKVTDPTELPQTPKPTEKPIPDDVKYKNRLYETKIFKEPALDADTVGTLSFEEAVEFVRQVDDLFSCIKYKGKERYCLSFAIVPYNETLYGYLPLESYGIHSCLIDVRMFIPNISVEQLLGTKNNCTGRILYEDPVPVMRIEMAKALRQAADIFERDGYHIRLYDAYRPKSAQFAMYDVIQVSAYVSNPYNGKASNHNRAKAVDIALTDRDGNLLSFPSAMHTFKKIVYRSSASQWTAEQRKNVDYMTNVMLSCGFKEIPSEWWHFSYAGEGTFPVLISYKDNKGKEHYVEMNAHDIPRYTYAELYAILAEQYPEYL